MKKERRAFLGGLVGVGAVGAIGSVAMLMREKPELAELPKTDRMPVAFIGHGTPRSATAPNHWTASWEAFGKRIPKPSAILSISAHWLTRGASLVTGSEKPQMNYDFYGFPKEMYEVNYPAPGDPELAKQVGTLAGKSLPVLPDKAWGFDHGTWVVLKYMFPKADIPVIQLSIDYSRPPSFHYELGARLRELRSRGVLIMGSGNFVHNLNMRPGTNNDRPYDWAEEFDARMWRNILEGNHAAVVDFQHLGNLAAQAHPSYDHFLPLLYCLGLKASEDAVTAFNDNFQWPAVSMRSIMMA